MRLTIDIETSPTTDPNLIEQIESKVKAPANYKNADTIQKWQDTQGAAERRNAVDRTALKPLYGSINTVTVIADEQPMQTITCLPFPDIQTPFTVVESEHDLLIHLAITIDKLCRDENSRQYSITPVGYNVQFDLHFLMVRALRRNAKQMLKLCRAFDKPLDVMTRLFGYKMNDWEKLSTVGALLLPQIPEPAEYLTPISELIEAGNYQAVVNHNQHDALLTHTLATQIFRHAP